MSEWWTGAQWRIECVREDDERVALGELEEELGQFSVAAEWFGIARRPRGNCG